MKLLILLGAITMAMGFPFGVPEYVRTSLGDSIDKSTMKVLKEAYASAANKNVVSSPLGLMTLLSLYNSGAGDATKVELNQFLGGSDHRELSNSYSGLSQRLADLDPSYLTLANKIYIGNGLTPTNQFAATARDYRSEVESIDFTKPADAAKIINKWSDEKTQGNIKDPVSPDALSPDVVAALVNVIFFKGHWHVPFSAKETKEKDFNIDSKTKVKKPMMHLLQSLFYTESSDLGARLIELPYKEYGFRMVVVLPNEVDGLPSVLEKAAEKGLLNDVFELSPAGRDIDLDIPKFEVKSKLDFNDILPKVGVSKIFDEAATGIVKGLPVKVSKAFQEAFIKVDEEGATAGAFTGLVLVPISLDFTPPKPTKFTVDRPFLYAILFEDKLIFAGTYTQ